MKKNLTLRLVLCLLLALCFTVFSAACSRSRGSNPAEPTAAPTEGATDDAVPAMPEGLDLGEDGVPAIRVYNVESGDLSTMSVEEYLQGVLAGEMRNDWPMEALKAQAVLARTFVMKFVSEKDSQYPGADISTDIAEAQAYDAAKVNDRIRKAVSSTRGQVLSYNGELPYAWFHAHSGGVTDLPSESLEYKEDDPGYVQAVESKESDKAPSAVKSWTASFDAAEVAEAAGVSSLTSVAVGRRSDAGRAVTMLINGKEISAPSLRLKLGGSELKSTLITDVSLKDDTVTFTGSGYGHGVGMSQWGAYGMAEAGSDYRQIVRHYFQDVSVVSMW